MKKKLFFTLLMTIALLSANQDNSYSQWIQISTPEDYRHIDTAGNRLWVTHYNGLSYSTNNGLNWISTALTENVYELDIYNSVIITTGWNNGVYISTNSGVNWTLSLSGKAVGNVACDPLYIITNYTGNDSGIYRSSNHGLSWEQINSRKYVQTLILSEGNLYIGFGFFASEPLPSFYKSTNYGNTFLVNLWMSTIYSIWAKGQTVYASANYSYSNNGLNKSVDGGNIFTLTNLTNNQIKSILCFGDTVIACSGSAGVHVSIDGGINWVLKNEGLGAIPLYPDLAYHNGNLFLLNTGSELWKRSLSNLLTKVIKLEQTIPTKFSLEQNYPNPFNPEAKIRFSIPSTPSLPLQRGTDVRLTVYDALGREVETLVNEALQPGAYEVTFNGSGRNSGVYFYRLVTNDYSETKRMLMIK